MNSINISSHNNNNPGVYNVNSESGLLEFNKEFRSKEKLPCYVFKYPDQASRFISNEIITSIKQAESEGRPFVLALSAGSTPTTVYDVLIKLYNDKLVSFKNVITFNIDEYYSIPRTRIQSYYRFMKENLFQYIDIPEKNINFLNSEIDSESVDRHCEEYEEKIKAVGGIDMLLLPIGKRIGFNEAGTTKNTTTRLVDIEQNTRIDAASDFFGTEHVPHQALTMGIQTFLSCKRVILVAFSEGKAAIVQKTCEGEVTTSVPPSCFQKHANCQLVIDEAAATEITRVKAPWTIHGTNAPIVIKWSPILARKAVIWLSLKLNKPILKLEEEEYHDNNLSSLLKTYGPCPNLNLKVFRYLQSTINGWPGGRPVQSPPKTPQGFGLGPLPVQVQNDQWDSTTTTAQPIPKRVIVFSPHPDDDVISMGGTFIRLCDQGHEVHVAYQTSGNIAVWDDDAKRFANFAADFCKLFQFDDGAKEKSLKIQNSVENFIQNKEPGQPDSREIQLIKGLIRQTEARAGARYAGVRNDRIHFLDLPFYETGAVKKKPLGQEDIDIMVKFLESVKPEIIFAAGDLSDPHGTHRVCLKAILAAIERLKDQKWMQDCQVWLYRGAWQEWEPERIEMAVPMSPHELTRKRMSIFKHQSQKDVPAFPGTDKREFWMRAEDRNRTTAKIYDRLGLTEFEAMEAFVSWSIDNKFGTNPI
ncbi:glucosamine-6-phosphate isomerase [Tieghemostelium lacteum]|uniref:Glucosamine-6-phosphate isomerase n=1 Tax=Tieghemostelium lacteum TaxID=361077 RepID=A0A151Z6Z6_TIELA|nr:glucosamine-6-phosphate isomerase [Tieghemostelium lacteum]|eukprot:KYQ89733.1 glucosamine-6-phosphate isomerase [Tieghemostelium lacteum]